MTESIKLRISLKTSTSFPNKLGKNVGNYIITYSTENVNFFINQNFRATPKTLFEMFKRFFKDALFY